MSSDRKGRQVYSFFLGLILVLGFWSGPPLLASRIPAWVKSARGKPNPSGDWIMGDAHWVIVRKEVLVGEENGKLTKEYRFVVRNISTEKRDFHISFSYDRLLRKNTQFQGWRMGEKRKSFNLYKDAIVVINAQTDSTVTSDNIVSATIPDVEPGGEAAYTYTVQDFGDFPGEDGFSLIDGYATQTLIVGPRSGQGQSLRWHWKSPGTCPPAPQGSPPWTFKQIPSRAWFRSVGRWGGMGVPHILVQGHSLTTWEATSRDEAKRFYELPKILDQSVKSTSTRLVGSDSDSLKKIQTLCDYVQNTVSYRPIEEGIQGWQPEDPDESLRTLSADCKGKIHLLGCLLKENGVESRPIAIHSGSGYGGYESPTIPTRVMDFNHVVLGIQLPPGSPVYPNTFEDGPLRGWVLFDPTERAWPWGTVRSGFEGQKAALLDSEKGQLFTIHTHEPALVRDVITLEAELTPTYDWKITLKGEGNGRVVYLTTPTHELTKKENEKIRAFLERFLAQALPGIRVLQWKGPTPGNFHWELTARGGAAPQNTVDGGGLLRNPLYIPFYLNDFGVGKPLGQKKKVQKALGCYAKWWDVGSTAEFELDVVLRLPATMMPAPKYQAKETEKADFGQWEWSGFHREKGTWVARFVGKHTLQDTQEADPKTTKILKRFRHYRRRLGSTLTLVPAPKKAGGA